MEQYGLRNLKIYAMYLLAKPAHTSQPPNHGHHVVLINSKHTSGLALEKYPVCYVYRTAHHLDS